MGKTPKTIRVPDDTLNRVKMFQDDQDIDEADAFRRLIDDGLAYHGYGTTVVTDGRGGFGGWVESTARRLLGVFALVAVLTGTGAAAFAATGLNTLGTAAMLVMAAMLVLGAGSAVAMLAGALAQGHDPTAALPWRTPR